MGSQKKPEFQLVVTNAFKNYETGQVITDASEMAEIFESEWQGSVVKSAPSPAAE